MLITYKSRDARNPHGGDDPDNSEAPAVHGDSGDQLDGDQQG
jgi:hypothetical protein